MVASTNFRAQNLLGIIQLLKNKNAKVKSHDLVRWLLHSLSLYICLFLLSLGKRILQQGVSILEIEDLHRNAKVSTCMMLVQTLMGSSIAAKETGEHGSLPRCVTA